MGACLLQKVDTIVIYFSLRCQCWILALEPVYMYTYKKSVNLQSILKDQHMNNRPVKDSA